MANLSSAVRDSRTSGVAASPRKWEFSVVKLDPNVRGSEVTILASASDGGWDLVTVTESTLGDRRYYFKRPL